MSASAPGADTLVAVEGLSVHFPITSGIVFQRKVGAVYAVDGLTFAIKRGETPEEGARREAREEAGFAGQVQMIPLYVAHGRDDWTYSNFLAIIDREFTPRLNWETQGFRWCRYGHWPHPLHKGLQALLSDPASKATIEKMLV